jgi:hypothetical protein
MLIGFRSMFVKAILAALMINSIMGQSKLELTLVVWKGQNCERVDQPPYNCKLDNLGSPAWSKVYTFEKSDSLCANIPGEKPSTDDPTNTVWPHSATWTSLAGSLSWEERIKNVCNGTHFNFKLYTDIKCPSTVQNFEASMPLDMLIPVKPAGWPVAYTEKFSCRVMLSERILITGGYLLLLLSILYLLG